MLQEMIPIRRITAHLIRFIIHHRTVCLITMLVLLCGCFHMTVGADGFIIYRACDDAIYRIDGKTINPTRVFSNARQGAFYIESFDILEDGHLMTIGLCPNQPERQGGRIIIWDLERKEPRKAIRPDAVHIYDMAINPEGNTLAVV